MCVYIPCVRIGLDRQGLGLYTVCVCVCVCVCVYLCVRAYGCVCMSAKDGTPPQAVSLKNICGFGNGTPTTLGV